MVRSVADGVGHSSLELVEPHTKLKGLVYNVYVAGNLLLKEAMGVSISKWVEESPALRDEI